MKKMVLVLVCAMLTANVFAAGGKKLFGKQQEQEQQQEQESVTEDSGFKHDKLMENLKAMKLGDYWVHAVDYGSGNGKMNILSIKVFYQMYTRVGGGFIVQTYTVSSNSKDDRGITNISSLFVSDKEMFGQ